VPIQNLAEFRKIEKLKKSEKIENLEKSIYS